MSRCPQLGSTPANLAHHQFIAWGTLGPRDLIHADGATMTLDPQVRTCRAIIDDGATQRAATVAGIGISNNSLWNIAHDLQAGRLIRVLPGWKPNQSTVLWLVYPRSNVLTPKTRFFIDFLIARL